MFVANNLKNAQLGRIAYNTKNAENTNKGMTFFWVNNIASFWASKLLRIVSIPFPMAPVWPEGFLFIQLLAIVNDDICTNA